nr:hypothetical protein [Candidatus Sigynarchaeota archaeon]
MVSLTLSISRDIKKKMDQFSEINWSEVARKAILQKIEDLEFLEEFKSRSDMDEKTALELGKKVNASLSKRYSSG